MFSLSLKLCENVTLSFYEDNGLFFIVFIFFWLLPVWWTLFSFFFKAVFRSKSNLCYFCSSK